MNEDASHKPVSRFSREVGAKETRRLKAQRHGTRNIWFGFGMFGLIGWSVVVPTLLGALLGAWLDDRFPGGRSWTLALLIAGLVIGCVNAWLWVARESKDMKKETEDKNE